MKKKSLALIVNLVLLAIILSMGVLFMDYTQSIVEVSAEEYSIEDKLNEAANFEDDSIIIVLKSNVSRFRGISVEIKEKIKSIGGDSIENLSELPANYVNTDGSINENAAPNLYSHYNKTEFKQILYVKLLTAGKDKVLATIEEVQEWDEVEYVGPNWIEETGVYVPNDTYYSQQWALNNNNGIKSESAWDITRGSNEVRVGIIDSGIATDGDLGANILTGYDFYNNNTVTNDVLGGHGTHVAGIVAAIGNNNLGISGVAPNVKLIPLQTAYDTSGSGNHHTSDRIEAINYAISLWEDEDQRISILNHSIAGFGTNSDIAAAANNFPGLFVWSAGNDATNIDTFSQISNFNLSNIISVGALTSTSERASYSNYGQNSVTIYAPGSDILSTFPTSLCSAGTCTANNSGGTHYIDGYHFLSGTSMAAPHVTGVAALLLSTDPTLTSAELKDIILNSADNITISVPDGSGGTATQTVKKLNAYNAVIAEKCITTNIGANAIRIDGIDRSLDGVLTIPSVVNGRTVTQIGTAAFQNQTQITELVLPDSLQTIGASAFENCTGLTSISLASVQSIGASAFENCPGLTSVSLSGVSQLGEKAFKNCANIGTVTLAGSLVGIGNNAFENCSAMTYISTLSSV